MSVDQHNLEAHELATIFPSMENEEFDKLVDSIKDVGLLEPVTLYQGKILDGIHRVRACNRAGHRIEYRTYDGLDPVQFVLAKNMHRRSLTSQQRAAVALKAMTWKPIGSGANTPGVSAKDMAEAADTSVSTIKAVKRAASQPGVNIDSIVNGEVSAFDEKVIPPQGRTQSALTPMQKLQRHVDSLKQELAEKTARMHELEDLLESYQETTSGDEKQRVLIAQERAQKIRTLEIQNANLTQELNKANEWIKTLKKEIETPANELPF